MEKERHVYPLISMPLPKHFKGQENLILHNCGVSIVYLGGLQPSDCGLLLGCEPFGTRLQKQASASAYLLLARNHLLPPPASPQNQKGWGTLVYLTGKNGLRWVLVNVDLVYSCSWQEYSILGIIRKEIENKNVNINMKYDTEIYVCI